jgi:hypothetical protein
MMPDKICSTNDELRAYFLEYMINSHLQPPVCASMMISKKALDTTGGYYPYFKGKVAEDIHWVYRILKKFKGITVTEPLYNYRIRNDSLTGLQLAGKNAKAAYAWHLLAKIIKEDFQNGIDVLQPGNETKLRTMELGACEDALLENIQSLSKTVNAYEKSSSYKLGRFLLWPFHYLKSLTSIDQ